MQNDITAYKEALNYNISSYDYVEEEASINEGSDDDIDDGEAQEVCVVVIKFGDLCCLFI